MGQFASFQDGQAHWKKAQTTLKAKAFLSLNTFFLDKCGMIFHGSEWSTVTRKTDVYLICWSNSHQKVAFIDKQQTEEENSDSKNGFAECWKTWSPTVITSSWLRKVWSEKLHSYCTGKWQADTAVEMYLSPKVKQVLTMTNTPG